MTTHHSRSRSTHMKPDTHLKPSVRQRATSSGGGSPHSFASNMAVVDGPAAVSGQYYGIFLGEPPKGFPASHLSSEPDSPRHSHSTHRSAGTSSGSIYGSNKQYPDTRSKRSSVAFPTTSVPVRQETATRSRRASAVVPNASVRESQTTPPFHVIRVDTSASHRTSVLPPKPAQPPFMPPSALKRDRRNTLSTYSGSSGELPAADLRYLCKFAMGSISECLRQPTNAPLFPRLMKTDNLLNRMHATLYAMAADPTLFNPAELSEIKQHLQRLQRLLFTVIASHSSTPDHLSHLDAHYRTLVNYSSRLETSLKIRDVESRINDLTFKHNLSQQASFKIHDAAIKLKNDPRGPHPEQRKIIRQSQVELDEMHEERVVLRGCINKAKDELWALKQQRDQAGGAKTVRFNQ